MQTDLIITSKLIITSTLINNTCKLFTLTVRKIKMYNADDNRNADVRESGENPGRPRHCNRDETALPLNISGRRASRMNGSQETGLYCVFAGYVCAGEHRCDM